MGCGICPVLKTATVCACCLGQRNYSPPVSGRLRARVCVTARAPAGDSRRDAVTYANLNFCLSRIICFQIQSQFRKQTEVTLKHQQFIWVSFSFFAPFYFRAILIITLIINNSNKVPWLLLLFVTSQDAQQSLYLSPVSTAWSINNNDDKNGHWVLDHHIE